MNRIIVLLFLYSVVLLCRRKMSFGVFTDKAGATFNPYEYFDIKKSLNEG